MSRIGKRPISIPNGVTIEINGQSVSVSGKLGKLHQELPTLVEVKREENSLVVLRANESRTARERHGLCRTLVSNMVEGVSQGFEKRLSIQGLGYRASAQGNKLTLNVGYSKPVEMTMPQGIEVAVENNTQIIVKGTDKAIVGNVAAKIRAVRPPEPYKGKGIRYLGEAVRRKAGKSGKK
jgi:large subunit ribosomal protein L6